MLGIRRLKKNVEKLLSDVRWTERRINEIKRSIWEMQNPFKFDVGETVYYKEFKCVICKKEIVIHDRGTSYENYELEYTVFNYTLTRLEPYKEHQLSTKKS